jgi:FkbM family methyltransferase
VSVRSPLWARAYSEYEQRVPDHRGKHRVLRALHEVGVRSGKPFACQMRNGSWLAIRPEEGLLVSETVGWTCFRRREWDPHVEACIRSLLRPGMTAIDVGANLGYFTAVMAQCVGSSGRVFAFEPVVETFQLLTRTVALNADVQVTALRLALGVEEGEIEITYDRRHSGIATMHPDHVSGETQQVTVRTLDALVSGGEVGAPDLMKVDVEGHELEAMRGAVETIRAATPAIVFEYNERAARTAGWTLAQAAELLLSCGAYEFALIDDEGTHPLDPMTFHLEPDEALDPHVDVLARVA